MTPHSTPPMKRYCKHCSALWEFALEKGDPIGAHGCLHCGGPLRRTLPVRQISLTSGSRAKSIWKKMKTITDFSLPELEGMSSRELLALIKGTI